MLQIKRIVLSLSVEVERFLDLISCHLSYSKQAFSKARQHLSYSAFVALNTHYVNHYYQYTDFLEQFVLSAELSPCTKGKRALFEEQYEQIRSKEMLNGLTGLFLMDRGYPSFELCKGIDLRGDAFVIRCKAGFNEEVKKFVKEDIEEKWVSFPYF
jgi:hypothetical protein